MHTWVIEVEGLTLLIYVADSGFNVTMNGHSSHTESCVHYNLSSSNWSETVFIKKNTKKLRFIIVVDIIYKDVFDLRPLNDTKER